MSIISAKKCGRWNDRKRFSSVVWKAYFIGKAANGTKRKVILFISCAVTLHMDKHRYRWTTFSWVSKRMNLVYTKWFCTQWDSKKDTLFIICPSSFCPLLYYARKLESHFNLAIYRDYVDWDRLGNENVLRHRHCNCTRELQKQDKET